MGLLAKRLSLRGGLLFALSTVPTIAWGQVREFAIPSESANKAIPEFARQAGVQIVAPAEQLEGIVTPAITGRLELHAALDRLLAEAPVSVLSDNGKVIILGIKKPSPERTPSAPAAHSAVAAASTPPLIDADGNGAAERVVVSR